MHIRYEDDTTNPGQPFACGATLDRVSAYTVDEAGREAFVTNNPLEILRKASIDADCFLCCQKEQKEGAGGGVGVIRTRVCLCRGAAGGICDQHPAEIPAQGECGTWEGCGPEVYSCSWCNKNRLGVCLWRRQPAGKFYFKRAVGL